MPTPLGENAPPERTFCKYQGTGNDFIILDERARGVKAHPPTPSLAGRLCNRHLGVGGDGVLTVLPPSAPGAVAVMHITNPDGSVPEMCGNGLRCVALYLVDQGGPHHFQVQTGAGMKTCTVRSQQRGQGEVSLEMGPVGMGSAAGLTDARELVIEGRRTRMLAVSVGNPHLVLDWDGDRELAGRLGPALGRTEGFPHGCNVEWISWDGQRLKVVVFERGAGLTMVCGIGAVASAFAAAHWGWTSLDGDRKVSVQLEGGVLEIGSTPRGEALLSGPACRVFEGVVEEVLWNAQP